MPALFGQHNRVWGADIAGLVRRRGTAGGECMQIEEAYGLELSTCTHEEAAGLSGKHRRGVDMGRRNPRRWRRRWARKWREPRRL